MIQTSLLRSWLAGLAIIVSGCATTGDVDRLDTFHQVEPASILVVPVVNKSTDIQAQTSVLATLPFFLAEKGYYVFPVNTVKTLLEYEGYYEAAEIHDVSSTELAELFRTDAILYVTIHEWTSKYILLATTTEVDFEYRLVAADGSEIWEARKRLTYTPQNNSSGHPLVDLVAMVVTAGLERAAPSYLPLTRQANYQVLNGDNVGIPPGPYSPQYDSYYDGLE